jgi:hypothetical protein
VVEPVAATLGLRRAGWPLEPRALVEVSGPRIAGLPGRAVVADVNGTAISTPASWERAVASLDGRNTFRDVNGDRYGFAGATWPYREVRLSVRPPDDLTVVVGGPLATTWVGSWFRQLSLGPSTV